MTIAKNLLEQLNNISEVLFVDFDAQKLYDTIVPKEQGFIDDEEIKQVIDCLELKGDESEEYLRGLRNTINRFASEKIDTIRNILAAGDLEGGAAVEANNEIDKLMDQRSAFTAVLDQQIEKAAQMTEGLLPSKNAYTVLYSFIEDKDGYNIIDASGEKMLLKSYSDFDKLVKDIAKNL